MPTSMNSTLILLIIVLLTIPNFPFSTFYILTNLLTPLPHLMFPLLLRGTISQESTQFLLLFLSNLQYLDRKLFHRNSSALIINYLSVLLIARSSSHQ